MGLEIKLSDSQIPPSKDFLDFLFRFRSGKSFKETWYDQLSEKLKSGSGQQVEERLKQHANKPLTDEVVKQALVQSYNYIIAILLGELEMLRQVLQKYKFIFVIGCPRSGGSYLTKQLYLSLGMKPGKVPGLLAHDGFPKAWPFYIGNKHNQHTDMARYVAEYLVMVDMFFKDRPQHENKIIIPKKDLNAAYHGAFFSRILGQDAEYIITVRHPVVVVFRRMKSQEAILETINSQHAVLLKTLPCGIMFLPALMQMKFLSGIILMFICATGNSITRIWL